MEMTTKPTRVTRIAILTHPRKDGVGVIALDLGVIAASPTIRQHFGEHFNKVGSSQPDFPDALTEFGSRDEVEKKFYDALATSHERGWTVAHSGERNYG